MFINTRHCNELNTTTTTISQYAECEIDITSNEVFYCIVDNH